MKALLVALSLIGGISYSFAETSETINIKVQGSPAPYHAVVTGSYRSIYKNGDAKPLGDRLIQFTNGLGGITPLPPLSGYYISLEQILVYDESNKVVASNTNLEETGCNNYMQIMQNDTTSSFTFFSHINGDPNTSYIECEINGF